MDDHPSVDERQMTGIIEAQVGNVQSLVFGLTIPTTIQAPATPQQIGQDGQAEAASNTLSTAPNTEDLGLSAGFQAVADQLIGGGQAKAVQNRAPVVKIDLQPNKPEVELNAQNTIKFSQLLATVQPQNENQAEVIKDQAAVVGQPLTDGNPPKAEQRPVSLPLDGAGKDVIQNAEAAVEQITADRAASQPSLIPSTLKQVTESRRSLHSPHLEQGLVDGAEQPVAVKADQAVTVKADQAVTVKADQAVTVKADQSVTVKADQAVAVKADQTVTVKADQTVTVMREHPNISQTTLAGRQVDRPVNTQEAATSAQKAISIKDGAEQEVQLPVKQAVDGVELVNVGKAMDAPQDIPNSELARLAEARSPHLTQQITRQVENMVDSGLKTLRMQLYPEALGKLELQLTSQGGNLKVVILADQAATQQMLERHALDLQQVLQQTGVNLTGLTIGQRSAGDQAGGDQRYFYNGPGQKPMLEDQPDEEISDEESTIHVAKPGVYPYSTSSVEYWV
jgi:flagellar hook-length control protein FliK